MGSAWASEGREAGTAGGGREDAGDVGMGGGEAIGGGDAADHVISHREDMPKALAALGVDGDRKAHKQVPLPSHVPPAQGVPGGALG